MWLCCGGCFTGSVQGVVREDGLRGRKRRSFGSRLSEADWKMVGQAMELEDLEEGLRALSPSGHVLSCEQLCGLKA